MRLIETYPLHYTSAERPGDDSPWTVYVEHYAHPGDAEPIDGSTERVSTHPTEAEANAEANRLQALTRVPDQHAHLSRCMNDGCGLPLYYVEGTLVDAIGHGSICDDEDAPHRHPDAAAYVEIQPVAPAEDEKSMVVTTPDDATMWAVYTRSNDGPAMWECDQDERADAEVAAHELAHAKDVPALDHEGKPLATIALDSPADLSGRTIATVTTRDLIARDMHNEYVDWTETKVTTTDGRHYTFAVDNTEVFSPHMEPETCVCGHVIVKEDGEYVHPFSYGTDTAVHDPEPAPARPLNP